MNAPPRLLDLFCGAGGCAKGYQQAGFHVTGVDTRPQPRYAGDVFIQGDALAYCAEHGHEYDAIHASPPCQDYSSLRHMPTVMGKRWPRLIAPTRLVLFDTGRPYIIENLPGAPLIKSRSIVLCGQMFGLRVIRHRRFEYAPSLFLLRLQHPRHRLPTLAHRAPSGRSRKEAYLAGECFASVTGNAGNYAGPGMGIDWMLGRELSQAIPPAYTRFIGEQLRRYV